MFVDDFFTDFSLKVGFVTHNHNWHLLADEAAAGFLQEEIAPFLAVLKRLIVADVVNDNATVGAFVELVSNGLEPFLASSIPQLEESSLTVSEFHWHFIEVSRNGWVIAVSETAFSEYVGE